MQCKRIHFVASHKRRLRDVMWNRWYCICIYIMLEWWSRQCEDIRMSQLMSRVCLYLQTRHFIIIRFIREDVVLKLWMFKCDVSITFNEWFWYIISLYCQLHRSGVMYSLYNTTCSTLNHVADASTLIYTYICVCVFILTILPYKWMY